MENLDKGLTVPKWVLIYQSKLHKMPKNSTANLSTLPQKFGILMKKKYFIGCP